MKTYSKVNQTVSTCYLRSCTHIIALIYAAFHVTVHDFSSRRPILLLRSGRSEITLNTSQHHDKELALDCHIASLEVVRGLERTFKIDHSGFSFTSANSTLKVSDSTTFLYLSKST